MARVKLSEFRAKSILVDDYQGHGLHFDQLSEDLKKVDTKGEYVLKVDQGIKKRGKQGLVAVGVKTADVAGKVKPWHKQGFERYIIEPMVPHEQNEEHYLSFERTREGIKINYSPQGGVDVEEAAGSIKTYTANKLSDLAKETGVELAFFEKLVQAMDANHMSFLEINPLVIQKGQPILLDAAVLVDSAGEYFVEDWSEDDVVDVADKTEAEGVVKELDANTPAALKLKVLNLDASLWLLLSGGGASITIADTVQAAGLGDQLGDYGEYSGGPTTEETYLYTKEIIGLALNSKAPKKAVVIAGGVANFTDVAKTFKGIIQALDEVADELKAADVKVFVRRGGPNEKEGLKLMEDFLKKKDLFGSIYGSDIVLTQAISDAIEFVGGSKK